MRRRVGQADRASLDALLALAYTDSVVTGRSGGMVYAAVSKTAGATLVGSNPTFGTNRRLTRLPGIGVFFCGGHDLAMRVSPCPRHARTTMPPLLDVLTLQIHKAVH